jgi:hypothetical protein
MCQQCGNNTRLSGLKEMDGLCIRCWREKAIALAESLRLVTEPIEDLRRLYGYKSYAAPDPILLIFEAADRARGDLSA